MKPLNPDMYHAPVIDVAKHLGNLQSGVWEKIKNRITYGKGLRSHMGDMFVTNVTDGHTVWGE